MSKVGPPPKKAAALPTLDDPIPAGPFVAKADATTGQHIWRTYVDNPNASGRRISNANLNILYNGKIAFAWSNQIVLLDTDTGLIRKHNFLPAGVVPIIDVNFKHLTVAPDRTLISKIRRGRSAAPCRARWQSSSVRLRG